MIRYSIRLIKRYSDHPLLAGLILAGVIFLGTGYVLEAQRGPDVWTGFFGIIATLFIAMALIGYALAFSAKGILLYQDMDGLT